jgi:hypothetical protein
MWYGAGWVRTPSSPIPKGFESLLRHQRLPSVTFPGRELATLAPDRDAGKVAVPE